MKKLFLFLAMLFMSTPALADLNYTTYAAGGPTPCQGCGTVLSTGTVTSINFEWGSGWVLNSGRSDGVVVKFTGFITVPGTGSQTITFYNRSDDGFILKLNGVTVLSDWQEQGPALYNGSGSVTLQGGQTYELEVWYYENGGGATAQLYWNQSGSIQLVGSSAYTITQPNPKIFGDGGSTLPATSIPQSKQDKINQTTNLSPTNSVYIQSYGTGNSVYVDQSSMYNSVRGVGTQAMTVNGSYNSIDIKQGTLGTVIGNNLAEVSVTGNSNSLNLTQQYNSKYTEVVVSGASNSLILDQKDSGGKSIFASVLSDSNTVSVLQQGTGNHYLDLSVLYNGSNISVSQSGVAQKMFSLTINSPNVGVTVSQTNTATSDSAAMTITCTTGPCTGYSYTKN